MKGGHLLREARKRAGMTQAEVARACGTTQSAIARVEAGAQSPTLEQLTKLIRASGFDLSIRLVKADPERSMHVSDALQGDPDERLRRVVAAARMIG